MYLSSSLNVSIKLINNHLVCGYYKIAKSGPMDNQDEITNKFESHLLSIRDDRQKM